jgi:Fe-S oxidoreductase
MRAIVEETLEMVREYKGSHSGEHGDGLARSEFHESMFGRRMVASFEEIKDSFDPAGTFNPGKIVRASKMDDRDLFRFAPGYAAQPIATTMDWSAWGGFNRAIEMCNNNGACRKADVAVMCPSYRVTGEEQHLTRGRANSLRLAISGQLGADALVSDAMFETMELCVSCKGCKRECPTGVDMAKMKIEFLHQYYGKHRLPIKDYLVAFLPRYAYWSGNFSVLLNLRDQIPGLAKLSELLLGFSSRRRLPRWRRDQFNAEKEISQQAPVEENAREVVLLVDTFNGCFEPENARAALAVLTAAGYKVRCPRPLDKGRPLCCGRTFLSGGLVNEARVEAERMIDTLMPFVERGVPIIGLEPSCLLTLRDEFPSLLPGADTDELAENAFLLEEFLAAEHGKGRLHLKLKPLPIKQALLHGHCHQKAFDVMSSVQQVLALIPDLELETIKSGCCGMAGAFGYDAKHYEISMKMGELNLLPAVRAADADTLIIADGTSCRNQIRDGTGREAMHVARVLEMALSG